MTGPRSAGASGPHVPPLVDPGPPLSAQELERYSRHLLLPHVGELGQRRLRNARVCVVGAGGLGSPVLQYLTAAGVGRIGVVDSDDVELSNLQRQVVHGVGDLGRPKVASAADALRRLDPDVQVITHDVRLTADTVGLLADYDLVVDGTDNFETRYLVNDACVRLGLPEVWGSMLRFDAQVSVFWGRPPQGFDVRPVQLRDLFPTPPAAGEIPSCAEAGVLGSLCGQVGSVMATEAVKLITGIGRPLLGRVLVLDALDQRWTEIQLVGATAEPPGSATVDRPTTSEEPRMPDPADQPVTSAEPPLPTVSAAVLAASIAAGGPAAPVVVDVRGEGERRTLVGPPAIGVPLAEILAGRDLERIPADRSVVLVCRSGVRSERAGRALRAAGYDDVAHLEGGALAWVAGTGTPDPQATPDARPAARGETR
jgi:adenylyltransferase/sulfurtransferase